MLKHDLAIWAQELNANLSGVVPSAVPLRVVFDSRAISKGDLFVALQTGQRDGHEFAESAVQAGALAVLASQSVPVPSLQVPDTLSALQTLGGLHRDAVPGKVFALTGSMGKTTTRRLLHSILDQRGSVLATEGNYNNHIGVPLTLCRYTDEQDVVLEMGANHQGEIAVLRQIVRPDVVGITLAGPAHLEGFGGIDGVVRGKGEILDELPVHGTAVLNADDPAFETWRDRVGDRRVISFGLGRGDVQAQKIQGSEFVLSLGDQAAAVTLALPGRHQIQNALCAAAMACADGVSLSHIVAGLQAVHPEAGRGQVLRHGSVSLIDDTYNANPEAMRAALQVLLAQDPKGLAILGEMRELGDVSEQAHREVGKTARELGLTRLWTLEPNIAEGFGASAELFEDHSQIAQALDALDSEQWVLVKGSRGAAMERCFTHWKEEA